MSLDSHMWRASRRFFRSIERLRRMQAGCSSRLAAMVNGWANIGLGLAPMLVVAAACWGACGILMLSLEGWSVNALLIWLSGAPASYPACSLRTDFWNGAYLVLSFVVGVSLGAKVRWCLIENTKPDRTAFKHLLWPFVCRGLAAMIIMLAVTYATAQLLDGERNFGQTCAAISLSEPF